MKPRSPGSDRGTDIDAVRDDWVRRGLDARPPLPASFLHALVDALTLPILVVQRGHVRYGNLAAATLRARLKREHGIKLDILIRDHLDGVDAQAAAGPVVTLLTAGNGEPFYVHVRKMNSPERDDDVELVTIRALAPDREAFTRRYRLSQREAEVVELVLRGYGNRDIAATLGITSATAKKHLTSVFNKVGVDSRAQLISRLA